MPADARVLNDAAPTIVGVTADAPPDNVAAFKARGAEIVVTGQGRFVDLPPLLSALSERYKIRRLLVEGGGTVHRSMIH